ncbi:uncharacterized protein LOC124913055 [Impatiens glandulifera]|uniref:uncharacterized protein LOC124913055 n=1 Tax=Impatiens glandulifera TaxID=253017 RepID=UPI001FB06B91|nr:uncharacterized protein LOC124913055 [Impatiens glandulifera]
MTFGSSDNNVSSEHQLPEIPAKMYTTLRPMVLESNRVSIPTCTPTMTQIPNPNIQNPNQNPNQPITKRKSNNDPLLIHPANHPGLNITSAILTGRETYYGWSLSIKLALQAKIKIGFIDGSYPEPKDQEDANQWGIVDALVRAWIMNTIEARIGRRFQSKKTSRDLWLEIKSRYEGNNGPRRYNLKKDISFVQQGDLDLEEYYSKVRLLWDEMMGLKPLRRCRCKGIRVNCDGCFLEAEMLQDDEELKLLQFLMGLDDKYEYVKDQILMQDPWPDVYKSFTMLQNVEKRTRQKRHFQESAIVIKEEGERVYHPPNKNKSASCTHCGGKCHMKDGCFKLIGYPEWWKQPKDNVIKKRPSTSVHATVDKDDF